MAEGKRDEASSKILDGELVSLSLFNRLGAHEIKFLFYSLLYC